jgi:hypothetical protein
MCSFGAKAMGHFKLLPCPAGQREGPHGFSFGEIGCGIQLFRRKAQEPALHGNRLSCKPGEIDGGTFACGATAAPHRTSVKDQLGSEAREFSLPCGFFSAGQLGHLGEMIAKFGVPGFEQGQELVTDAIAREGEMAIGGIFAPELAASAEEGFDFAAGSTEDGAKDAAFGKFENGMDAGESFGPRAAQELGEYGFGLIVEGVRCGYGVHRAGSQEVSKPAITKATRCLLDGLGGFAHGWIGTSLKSGVDAMLVKSQAHLAGKVAAKCEIAVGFGAAEAVVQVRNVEDETEFPAVFCECAKEGYRVGATGETDGETKAGLEQRGVDRKGRELWSTHMRMIRRLGLSLTNLLYSAACWIHEEQGRRTARLSPGIARRYLPMRMMRRRPCWTR